MNKTKKNCSTSSNIRLHDVNIQNELALKAKQGNKAASDLLVDSLSGFVIAIAKKKAPSATMVPDLIQEGYIAIIKKAIPTFDSSMKTAFRSYAVYWILSAVEKYLNDNLLGFPFRVPAHVAYAYRYDKKDSKSTNRWKKDVEELRNQTFNSMVKNQDGELIDVFDIIPSIDEKYNEIFDKDYVKDLDSTVINALKANNKTENINRTIDMVLRYFCIGKYSGYPTITSKHLAEFYGISQQRASDILKYANQKLKSKLSNKYKNL